MVYVCHIMFVYFVHIFPSLFVAVNGALLFNRCPGSQERCGLFGLNIVMHSDDNIGDGTNDQCIDHCVFFYNNKLQCGSCSSRTTEDVNVPNPSPVNDGTLPTASITGEYDITYSLVNVPTIDQVLFSNAAQRWESIIVGDLPDVPRNRLIYPLDKGCPLPVTIDDIYICAKYCDIDGPSNIIGSATICETRGSSPSLPITGHFEIDSTDISMLKIQNTLPSLIFRTMGQVLGFGILWEGFGVAELDEITGNCTYSGRRAQAEYAAISGCGQVPVDPYTDDDGTRCIFWGEECMGTELLAGFIVGPGPQPLSRISIASFEDIGYTVDYASADPYTRANLSPRCQCRRREQRTLLDMFHGEVHHLGLRHPSVQRRKLSDEMYNMAVSYGKEKLAMQHKKRNFGSFFLDHTTHSESTTLTSTTSSSVIAVFVMQNETIFEVIVRSDS